MTREWMSALRPAPDSPSRTPPPVCAAQTLSEAEAVLGEAAVAWAVEASIAITGEVEVAARADPRLPLTGLELAACEAGLLTVLCLMRQGRDSVVSAPEEAVEQVRLAVRQGTPIDSVVRVVWMCHTGVQDRLLSVVGDNVSPGDIVAEVRELTHDLQVFADVMARELSAAYEAERVVWQDRMAAARRQVVDEIVTTGRAPEAAEQVLGFPLAGHHLAGVLWTADSLPNEDVHAEHARYVNRLTAVLGARGASLLDHADGSIGILWSFPGTPRRLSSLIRSVDRPRRAALALGPVGSGVAGLRQSVLGARQTRAVATRRSADVWSYDDVALLALLLADEDSAGRFVRRVLAGLTGTDPKSAAVRDTLAAYLRHGRGRTAAAHELRLAANTVAYRVKQAEEALGRTATERALDTMVALMLASEQPGLLTE